jgi:hypothetical protein
MKLRVQSMKLRVQSMKLRVLILAQDTKRLNDEGNFEKQKQLFDT